MIQLIQMCSFGLSFSAALHEDNNEQYILREEINCLTEENKSKNLTSNLNEFILSHKQDTISTC